MPDPLTTTALVLASVAHAGTIKGRAKLLLNKVKNKLKSHILTDTLETIETAQQNEQPLTKDQQEDLKVELDTIFEDNPSLKEELHQLITKEAQNDPQINQMIGGNITNMASDYGVNNSGIVQGDMNVTHHHGTTQTHSGSGDNVAGDKVMGDKVAGDKVVKPDPKPGKS